jgi:hypothetical protein
MDVTRQSMIVTNKNRDTYSHLGLFIYSIHYSNKAVSV